jgi:hypothetical protein
VGRVAADPGELRTYAGRVRGRRDDAADAVEPLARALDRFAAVLPGGLPGPVLPDLAGCLVRVGGVDDQVAVVADAFERADTPGDGRLHRIDDAHLVALGLSSIYGERRRRELRARAVDELVSLRERIAAGDVDETTVGELVAVLALLRRLVDTASDGGVEAADLIGPMGPGDLHEALALLEDHARDHRSLAEESGPVRAIADLAHVVSLGLDRQPGRARRWAADLAGRRDVAYDKQALEGLVLLGAYNAPGTHRFGVALVDQMYGALPVPTGGLVDRVHRTTSPLAPVLATAARQPALASGIVNHLLASDPDRDADGRERPMRFDVVFERSPRDFRFTGISDSLLGAVIVAAVDPELPAGQRMRTAHHLAEHYVSVGDAAYAGEVTQGFAAATQPLLERWLAASGSEGGAGGEPAPDGDPSLALLPEALGRYGATSDGVNGLRAALSEVTTIALDRAEDAAQKNPGSEPAYLPFHRGGLERVGELHGLVVTAVGNERFRSAFERAGGGAGRAAEASARGLVEELPGGSSVAGLFEAVAALDGDPAAGGSPAIGLRPQVTNELVERNLAARPDLATPEVVAHLEQARRTDEVWGVHDLIHRSDLYDNPTHGGPALERLRMIVSAQRACVDMRTNDAVAELTDAGPE